MNLEGKTRCSKGFRKNKTKTAEHPYDCIKKDDIVKKRCPKGTHKTKKGCVKNSSARNARTRRRPVTRRRSLRTYAKFVILKSTTENFKGFVQELTDDPAPTGLLVIPLTDVNLLIDKIQDEIDKGGEELEVKINREDLFVFQNTKVGRKWRDKIDYKPVPRGSSPRSPRIPRLPRDRHLQDPNSLRQYPKFYMMKGKSAYLKKFIRDLKNNPYPKDNFPGIISKPTVYLFIKKIQKEINKGEEDVEVKIDRGDMSIILNTDVGYEKIYTSDDVKIIGMKRTPRT